MLSKISTFAMPSFWSTFFQVFKAFKICFRFITNRGQIDRRIDLRPRVQNRGLKFDFGSRLRRPSGFLSLSQSINSTLSMTPTWWVNDQSRYLENNLWHHILRMILRGDGRRGRDDKSRNLIQPMRGSQIQKLCTAGSVGGTKKVDCLRGLKHSEMT